MINKSSQGSMCGFFMQNFLKVFLVYEQMNGRVPVM